MLNINQSLLIAFALKLRQNWRAEAAHLPAPARLAAFTLIELSIVLVIIGLIVGGVLVGQDMIKAAELRNLVSSLQEYETAMMTFKGKYGCVPGDCPNIESIFGSRGSSCRSAADWKTYNNAATCNGNGDRAINLYGSGPGSPTQWYHEGVTLWSQLYHAGIIKQKYTGVGKQSTFWGGDPGVNIPNDFRTAGTMLSTVGSHQHRWQVANIGSLGAPSTTSIDDAVFTVEELKALDKKFDDGKPILGKIRNNTWYGYVSERCTSNNSTNATYTNSEGILCSLLWTADPPF